MASILSTATRTTQRSRTLTPAEVKDLAIDCTDKKTVGAGWDAKNERRYLMDPDTRELLMFKGKTIRLYGVDLDKVRMASWRQNHVWKCPEEDAEGEASSVYVVYQEPIELDDANDC